MIRYPNLIPECNVDTVFVEALGYPGPNHAPSINQVCAILEKRGPQGKAIGFIDNDKKSRLIGPSLMWLKTLGMSVY